MSGEEDLIPANHPLRVPVRRPAHRARDAEGVLVARWDTRSIRLAGCESKAVREIARRASYGSAAKGRVALGAAQVVKCAIHDAPPATDRVVDDASGESFL
jgi:hypothetical protein